MRPRTRVQPRYDRLPRYPPVTVDTPEGLFCEMDVGLSDAEIAAAARAIDACWHPSPRTLLEPWVRLRLSAVEEPDGRRRLVPEAMEWGVEVIEQDDGA